MDKYAELREALESGPSLGEWSQDGLEVYADGCEFHPIAVCVRHPSCEPQKVCEANAEYIAACHPEAIRALIDERDALREALDLVNDLSSQEWQDQNGKRMAATGNDGKRFWFITDDVMRVVRAALAQKQGEKHDNRT